MSGMTDLPGAVAPLGFFDPAGTDMFYLFSSKDISRDTLLLFTYLPT
jgi:hypothetical protein